MTVDKNHDIILQINGKLDFIGKILFLDISKDKLKLLQLRRDDLIKTPARKDIWNLCNGSNTIGEIAEELKRKQPNISAELKKWLEESLIFEIKDGTKKYPLSIDS